MVSYLSPRLECMVFEFDEMEALSIENTISGKEGSRSTILNLWWIHTVHKEVEFNWPYKHENWELKKALEGVKTHEHVQERRAGFKNLRIVNEAMNKIDIIL